MSSDPLHKKLTPEVVSEMTDLDLVNFLIRETSEDAVSCFVHAISCFGVTDNEDMAEAMERDPDTRAWAEYTALMIPPPYNES